MLTENVGLFCIQNFQLQPRIQFELKICLLI